MRPLRLSSPHWLSMANGQSGLISDFLVPSGPIVGKLRNASWSGSRMARMLGGICRSLRRLSASTPSASLSKMNKTLFWISMRTRPSANFTKLPVPENGCLSSTSTNRKKSAMSGRSVLKARCRMRESVVPSVATKIVCVRLAPAAKSETEAHPASTRRPYSQTTSASKFDSLCPKTCSIE